jgi:tungstate transport system substrate-binding protein
MILANRRSLPILLLAFLLAILAISCGRSEPAGGRRLRLATTTSVQDSGLLDVLAPAFEKKTGYHLDVSAVGSGKALGLLKDGGADVAVTHAPEDEEAALAAGSVARRVPFMHNEFILVGPRDQASVLAGATTAVAALRAIAASGRKFASRGDDSGTHRRELALWKSAGVDPAGAFIVHTSAGMAATLARASEEGDFALCDRATYVAKQKDVKLAIVFQGDAALRNTYSVIEPKAGSQNLAGAHELTLYVESPEGRALIGAFGIDTLGEPLFTPGG